MIRAARPWVRRAAFTVGVLVVLAAALRVLRPVTARATVPVHLVGPPSEAVRITAIGPFGALHTRVRLRGGSARVTLRGPVTRTAGVLTIVAGGRTTAAVQRTVVVTPGRAKLGIGPMLAGKSIRVGGIAWTQILSTPEDALGNAVVDGTPVQFFRARLGQNARFTKPVMEMLAKVQIWSQTRATDADVSAQVGGVPGTLERYREIPTRLAAGQVLPPSQPLDADGRTLTAITSGILTDRYGNPLADGTSVRFDVQAGKEIGTIDAETSRGVASVRVRAPQRPVVWRISVAGGTPTAFRFRGTVAAGFPVVAKRTPHSIVVAVGPVIGYLGARSSDGMTATATLLGGTTVRRQQAALVEGTTRLTFGPDDQATRVRVEVGGRTQTVAMR
jgi:hypothetical protein